MIIYSASGSLYTCAKRPGWHLRCKEDHFKIWSYPKTTAQNAILIVKNWTPEKGLHHGDVSWLVRAEGSEFPELPTIRRNYVYEW